MASDRLDAVKAQIAKAAKRYHADGRAVTLIAVSKTFEPADIEPVLKAGQIDFGENRVQEAKGKWPALKQKYPGTVLHLIGPLQTNKVKDAVALFDVIHSVDREKLARALKKEMDAQDRHLPVFIQVNIGAEEQKAGIPVEDTPAFVRLCRDEIGLDVKGLMCIPPADEPAGAYFALLRQLGEGAGLDGLSMGMSADFAKAVEMGATHVRVGSAIFGSRH